MRESKPKYFKITRHGYTNKKWYKKVLSGSERMINRSIMNEALTNDDVSFVKYKRTVLWRLL